MSSISGPVLLSPGICFGFVWIIGKLLPYSTSRIYEVSVESKTWPVTIRCWCHSVSNPRFNISRQHSTCREKFVIEESRAAASIDQNALQPHRICFILCQGHVCCSFLIFYFITALLCSTIHIMHSWTQKVEAISLDVVKRNSGHLFGYVWSFGRPFLRSSHQSIRTCTAWASWCVTSRLMKL